MFFPIDFSACMGSNAGQIKYGHIGDGSWRSLDASFPFFIVSFQDESEVITQPYKSCLIVLKQGCLVICNLHLPH